ncbi:MAG: DUF2007 domain-containing protein [Actinomycetota bacterium]
MSVGIELPPPPTLPDGHTGGGGGGWSVLVRASNDIDAHLLVGRLNEAGVQTHAIKDRRASRTWLIGGSDPWAPVTVWVLRRQLDAARLVLAEISLEGLEEPSEPVDGGDAGDEAAGSAFAFTWWVVALALGILLMLISLEEAWSR